MKKFSILLILVFFYSCSRDSTQPDKNELPTNIKLISKIVLTNANSQHVDINFSYNNDKNLTRIYNSDFEILINYVDKKVSSVDNSGTKMIFNYNSSGQLSSFFCPNLPMWQGKSATYNISYDGNNNVNKIVSVYPYFTQTSSINYINNKISSYSLNFDSNPTVYGVVTNDSNNSAFKNIQKDLRLCLSVGDYGDFNPMNLLPSMYGDNNLKTYTLSGSSSSESYEFNYEYLSDNFPHLLNLKNTKTNEITKYEYFY